MSIILQIRRLVARATANRASPGQQTLPSGSRDAMDRPVQSNRNRRRMVASLVVLGGAAGIATLYSLAPGADSQTVQVANLQISTVSSGEFEDFLALRARVTPKNTVFLDAVEGGRVEAVLVEDGALVREGDVLAVLSNAELQLSVLARQTEVTQQLNVMRSQELALEQTRSQNRQALLEAELALVKVERQHAREQPLAKRGFVAAKVFEDTRSDMAYQRSRAEILRQSVERDERLQASQLSELRAAARSMQEGLGLARSNLEALNLRAPVSGQVSAFSIRRGQSLARGERLGQIDSIGRNKLTASVDEFHLDKVATGQSATVLLDGQSYALKIAKVYPQVRDGQFQVDLQFEGEEPRNLRRGQSLQLRLNLSDPAPAILLRNGAFYNDTGGNWVFLLAPDGTSATKRTVRLGRRNANVIEVLGGLEPGDRVLTSPYTGFADKTRLNLTSN